MDQPWKDMPATGPLLRPAQAAAYLGYSRAYYYRMVKQGRVPKPLSIGPSFSGATGVPQPWLDAVIAAAAA